ncbi:MAG: PKD domain-containing protein [Thermoplasmata archaeon]
MFDVEREIQTRQERLVDVAASLRAAGIAFPIARVGHAIDQLAHAGRTDAALQLLGLAEGLAGRLTEGASPIFALREEGTRIRSAAREAMPSTVLDSGPSASAMHASDSGDGFGLREAERRAREELRIVRQRARTTILRSAIAMGRRIRRASPSPARDAAIGSALVLLSSAARADDLTALFAVHRELRSLARAPRRASPRPAGRAGVGPAPSSRSSAWTPLARDQGPGPAGERTARSGGRSARRPPSIALRATTAFALCLLMVIGGFQAVGAARALTTPAISVSGMNPTTATAGVPMTVFANITGGVPTSTVAGTFSGYLLLWFYGQTNSTGAIGYDKSIVPPPAGCASAGSICTSSEEVSFTHTYARSGSFAISLTVYDAEGDYQIATDVANVLPPVLHPSITTNVTTANEDSPIEFTGAATTTPASYESDALAYRWDFGDNNSTWGNPVAHAYRDAGNYVVGVTVYDNRTGAANQSFRSDIRVVNPLPNPVITFTTSSLTLDTYAEDTNVTVSGAATTDVPPDVPHLRYWWDFGDGTLGAGITASHVYTESGTYAVTLRVTDEEGATALTETTVTIVNPPPGASAGATPVAPYVVGAVIPLNGTATVDVPTDLPGLNYSWSTSVPNVSDASASNGVIGRTAYFEPGTYTANLAVTDEESLTSHDSTSLVVSDVNPNVGLYSAYTLANITLTMKGTPGNTLNVSVLENGRLIAYGLLVRAHGDPRNDVLTLTNVPIQLADNDTIRIAYVAPSSGTIKGANPVDLTVDFWGNGGSCATTYSSSICSSQLYTHRFIASQTATTIWNIDGNAASVGQLVFLKAQVFSPSRTHLTTIWNFGDGASSRIATAIPLTAEPTLGTIAVAHRWLPGGSYELGLSVEDDYAGSFASTIPVVESGDASVADVAPTVQLVVPDRIAQVPHIPLNATITSLNYSSTSFGATWAFGDGGTSHQSGVGPLATITHLYRYSATSYALALYVSDGALGYTTVSWQFVNVTNAPPIPTFTGPGGSIAEFTSVAFDATSSVDYAGAAPGGNLSFHWTFGDGQPSGALVGAGPMVEHTFTSEGTFPVTLTVTDDEGLSASTTHNVVVSDASVGVTLSDRSVTVDEYALFAPRSVGGAPADLARMSGVWDWGDGTPSTGGLTTGHTYAAPGTYTQTLTLSTEDGSPVGEASATVTVVNQPLTVVLPYDGFTVYGVNHTAPFMAIVLGSAADRANVSLSLSYAWTFGDGSGGTTTSGSLVGTVGHTYTESGNPVLAVQVSASDGRTATSSAQLISVPNWDGDGIPDEYATLFLHLAPGNDANSGTGLTDFMRTFIVGGQASNADTDHDGLTDFQEVFGTVTGYVSNPLDPNSAGDSILDGSHQFSDGFSSTEVSSFATSGVVTIPSVQHPGSSASIRSVTLYDEIVSPDLASLSVELINIGGGVFPVLGTTVALGTPTAPVSEIPLFNNTPVGGAVTNYSSSGLTLAEFQSRANWDLAVSGGPGTIENAQIVIQYYTDPTRADPYASGLVTGGEISIPVFNCTEPIGSNYTVFDGRTMSYSTVNYYPYTEQYWKLSVVQGLPYYPSVNVSYARGSASGCTVSDPHAWATYYGDRQFHIPPWAVHFSDPTLTDGMKAYGRAIYDTTANHALSSSANAYVASEASTYPWDGLAYAGPLNPTTGSTGTNGALDSLAVNPTSGPKILGVYLKTATSGCISIFDFGADSNAGGVVQIQASSYPGSPSMYTPTVGGSNDYSFGDTCVHWSYSYYVGYQLPVDPTASTIKISLALYQDYSLGSGSAASTSMTFSSDPASGSHTYNQGGFSVVFQVYALARMPVTLLNSTGEVQNIPGYGPHYNGDQHFYAFYLDIVGGSVPGTPLVAGQNLLLVSRTAFGNSTFSTILDNGQLTRLPCLSLAQFSNRTGQSAMDIAGSLTATIDTTCAGLLIRALQPVNSTGAATGGFTALSQLQFELLGVDGSVAYAAPYFPLGGYNSAVGVPPQNFWQALGAIIVSVVDAIVSVVLAVANFIVNLAKEIGQWVVGAWNAAISAIKSAINAILSALNFILQWVKDQLTKLFTTIKNALETAFGTAIAYIALPLLSILLGTGAIASSAYNGSMQNIFTTFNLSGPILSPLDLSGAGNDIAIFLDSAAGLIGGIFAIVAIVMYVIDVVSLGTATPATEGASTAVQAVIAGIVAGGLAALLAAGSILTSLQTIVPNFGGTDPFSTTIDFLANNSGAQLGEGIVNAVLTFFQGLADLLFTYLTQSIDGNYIVGLAIGFLALVASVIALAVGDTLAQVILSAAGVVLAAISVIVQLYPSTEVADEASQTSIADAAGITLGLAGLGLSIPSLVTSSIACASNCT